MKFEEGSTSLQNLRTLSSEEDRDNAMDMNSGNAMNGKPQTLPKIARNEDKTLCNAMGGVLNTACSWITSRRSR